MDVFLVDPLATDSIMTRQRGIRVLGDTGKIVVITLKLPILAETGIVMPGTLISYIVGNATKIGMVRGVSVDYSLPAVWQTIKVETHEYL